MHPVHPCKKSFCARGRDQTPELERRHFVSLVDFFFPFLFSSWPFVVLRVSSWIAFFFLLFQVSRAPAPHDERIIRERKQGTRVAYREHGKVPVPLGVSLRVSWSSFVCLRG